MTLLSKVITFQKSKKFKWFKNLENKTAMRKQQLMLRLNSSENRAGKKKIGEGGRYNDGGTLENESQKRTQESIMTHIKRHRNPN